MSDKQIKARVRVKADSLDAWNLASSSGFTPLEREPIFYTDTGDIKLGDNINTPDNLPIFNKNIKYIEQELSDEQKQTARDNIGAVSQAYVDNAVANAGGGSGGAGYGNAPIQKWEMNLTSDSDKTYSLAFTQTGPTVYEGSLFISVVDVCGQTWTGGQNITLLINGVDLTGYEIFKNIVVRPNKQWYWTTYETTFSEEFAGAGVDTNAEFATSSSVTLQLYNRQGSSDIQVGYEDQCWGLKVKVDTNTKIISIFLAEGGSVLF